MVLGATKFHNSIKGKIVIYTGSVIMMLLVSVIALLIRDMYLRLLSDCKERLSLNCYKAALKIQSDNESAVDCARTMALAQESGMFGEREKTIKFMHAVAKNFPQFFDAYTIYEPNADGQDDRFKNLPGSSSAGRFNAVVNNVAGKQELVQAVNMESSLYYRGLKEKYRSGAKEKYMITEPYVYEGVMMVEQTYPIVIDGKFAGITGVDRTLISMSKDLAKVKPYESANFILISRLGGIISNTLDPQLNTKKINETPYKDILNYYYKDNRQIRSVADPVDGDEYFYAGAPIDTGDWTLVMRVSEVEMIRPIKNTLIRVILVAILGILATFAVLVWIGNSIAKPIRVSVRAAQRVAGGDFTELLETTQNDETGELLRAISTMTKSLSILVGKVQKSCVQVTSSAAKIAASSAQLEATVSEQAASTHQVRATAKEISANSQEQLVTMNDVSQVFAETASMADSGRADLAKMATTMQELVDATAIISSRLAVINERANNISNIVTTIGKVSDQTNLLSLNASIEAEKAGELGRGFAVVAREIRRLADQTALATLDIEKMVREMQAAVSEGVLGMDKFSEDVRSAMDEITSMSSQLEHIIRQVEALTPRFGDVNEGMQAQSLSAQQISEAIAQLSDVARQTSESVAEFHNITERLEEAAGSLDEEVSRFKVKA